MNQDRISSVAYRKMMGLAPPEKDGKSKPQIRLPKSRRMNKTEEAWMEQLKRSHHPSINEIMYEPVTLRLPSGTKYTPDFMVYSRTTFKTTFYEVKGPHIHNSASIRAFKEARSAFPFWTFIFAQKLKTGWATTETENVNDA